MYKKIITIHSEDRDINKWPNSNEFEVILPDSYKNIKEVNLLNFTNTNNFYNISKSLNNNILIYNNNSTVIINDGFYTAKTLQALFNANFQNIKVKYLENQFKFIFYNSSPFNLNFNEYKSNQECSINNLPQNKIPNQYSHWGIGYTLGFLNKQIYNSIKKKPNDTDINLNNIDDNDFYIISDGIVDLNINNTIYMEIDKFNNGDEITPYQYRSNNLYCNDYSSMINSFFAKILLNKDNSNNLNISDRNNNMIINGNFICNNIIDRLMKFKFKFRYHNGMLVDFRNNFNFTIELILGCK